MKMLLPAILAVLAQVPAADYAQRREALRKALPDGIVVAAAAAELPDNSRSIYLQDTNYLYLTGQSDPGGMVAIGASLPGGEILFLPRRDKNYEKWHGRRLAPEDADAPARTGFAAVEPIETFESRLPKLIEGAPRIYTISATPLDQKLRALLPVRTFGDARNAIARLRMVKSAAEQEAITRALEASVEAHRAAWRAIAPGLFEYQVAGLMRKTYNDRGCEMDAYPPIVGAGPNSVALHYFHNSRRMDSGEVLLMDVGAQCGGYAADITRTVPVNGRFTQRQREVYQLVLDAQQVAIDAVKPGVTLGRGMANSLHTLVKDFFDSQGKARLGKPMGEYFNHGLGHHVGLDVHDAFDATLPLAEGMIVTIEPGLYIPEENLGVRLEDMVLVTATGGKLLTGHLPRAPSAVEQVMSRKPR